MKRNTLNIVQVEVGALNPATYNPRKWSKDATRALKESIARFGLVDPIIANSAPERKNIVIGGHFRLKVAKDLGYMEMPVVYLCIPDVEKEKELNLRLNKNIGEWDLDMLREISVEMLSEVGFSQGELNKIWDEVSVVEDDNFNPQEAVKRNAEYNVKEGDVFQMGKHKLVCGDSTMPEVLEKLLGNVKASMVYCDPPYNISLDYNNGVGTKGKYGGTKVNDSKTDNEYKDFIGATIRNAVNYSANNSHFFYWCDERYIGLFQKLYDENDVKNRRVCLWIKNNQNVTPQVAFNKVYEPCVYGTRGAPFLSNDPKYTEILNKNIDNGNQCIEDILDIFNIWLEKRIPTNQYHHPTEKPPTLHEKPLHRCTSPGDVVLDLFGGSGSTLIACEQMNRRCYTVELDPVFCSVILSRYETLTGNKVKKLNI